MNLLISLDGIPAKAFAGFSEGFLRKGFSRVEKLQTTFPSVTYTSHMSAITGEDPLGHGVFENVVADNIRLHRQELYDAEESLCRKIITAGTLFETLEEAGLKTLAINWPLANGFAGDFVKEEHAAHDESSSAEAAVKNDEKVLANVCRSIKPNGADFIAAHFLQYDASAHVYGVDAAETQKTLETLMEYASIIAGQADRQEGVNVVFFSDHGMVNRTGSIFPNRWIAQNGFEKEVQNKRMRFVCDGSGSALLYSQLPEERNREVLKCLSETGVVRGVYFFENRTKSNYIPKAAVDFSKGICAEDVLSGQEARYADMKGLHGHHGDSVDEMNGFLMAYGPGIKKSASVQCARMMDIAPTMAYLCGSRHPCSGKKIGGILAGQQL